MRQSALLLFGLTILFQCKRVERSDIEKVTVDLGILKKIQTDYDTFYVSTPKGYDFYKVEIYERDTTISNLIFKDSLDNILAIRMTENDIDIFVQEFYQNGQAKGSTGFVPGKIEGKAKYYYQDGRIRAMGQWKNGQRT